MSRRVRFTNDHSTYDKPPPTEIYTSPPRTRTFNVTIEHIDPKKVLHNRSIARQVRTPTLSFGNSKENFIRAETVALKRAISMRNRLIIRREGFINGLLQYNGQDISYLIDNLARKIYELSLEVHDRRETLQLLRSFS